MKKIICIIMAIIFVLIPLSSCDSAGADGGSQAYAGNESSISALSENESMHSEENFEVSNDYLKIDPDKGSAYNSAIEAYNSFLNGKISATIKNPENSNKTINITSMTKVANGREGIDKFALYDLNGDKIPELLTSSLSYDIFSYDGNQVIQWYTSPATFGESDIYLLNNGALLSVTNTTGIQYIYTTFDIDGTALETTFSAPPINDSSTADDLYYFNNKEVSKQEWDNLTEKYIAMSNNRAQIEWYAYSE